MPKVGNKEFPYTPAGFKAAKKAARTMPMMKAKSGRKQITSDGYMVKK